MKITDDKRIISALAEPAGEAEPVQVGWAYRDKRWDEDRWHVCGWEKPREAEGREVRPIFIGTTPPDASAIREAEKIDPVELVRQEIQKLAKEKDDAEYVIATIVTNLKTGKVTTDQLLEWFDGEGRAILAGAKP